MRGPMQRPELKNKILMSWWKILRNYFFLRQSTLSNPLQIQRRSQCNNPSRDGCIRQTWSRRWCRHSRWSCCTLPFQGTSQRTHRDWNQLRNILNVQTQKKMLYLSACSSARTRLNWHSPASKQSSLIPMAVWIPKTAQRKIAQYSFIIFLQKVIVRVKEYIFVWSYLYNLFLVIFLYINYHILKVLRHNSQYELQTSL